MFRMNSVMIVITTALAIAGASQPVLAAVRACPPGYVQGSTPSHRDDPTFRGAFMCQPIGMVDCGNGRSCPAGYQCRAGGGCVGPPPRGQMCNRLRCPTGYLCGPGRPGNRGCYDPRIAYVCGAAVCGKTAIYAPGDRCYPCYVRRKH